MTVCSSVYIKEIDIISEMVQSSIRHPFVNDYVSVPPMSAACLPMLFFMLTHAGLDSKQKQQLCVAVTLMQLGLETHQAVSVLKSQSKRSVLTRQLSVLAGDYYSSKYYYILSSLNEVDLIQRLSLAIGEINEAKMNLYLKQNDQTLDTESYFSHTETIYSKLYFRLAEWLGDRIPAGWLVLIPQMALAEQLIDDRDQLIPSNGSDELIVKMERKISALLSSSEQVLNGMTFEGKYEMFDIVNDLKDRIGVSTRLAK